MIIMYQRRLITKLDPEVLEIGSEMGTTSCCISDQPAGPVG